MAESLKKNIEIEMPNWRFEMDARERQLSSTPLKTVEAGHQAISQCEQPVMGLP
jgi:hypothetical protein